MGNMYTYDHLQKVFKHPEILCRLCGKDKHTKIHGDWIKYCWANGKDEHVLMAHRGSYKTSAITEVGTIWYLMFHPDARIFIVRKTFTESAENLRNIVNMMMIPEVSELLRLAWFGPKSKDQWSFTTKREGRFELSVKKSKTKENSVMCFGIDSGFTGYHCTKFIADDTVTLRDRLSQADRDKTKIVIQELRSNIIEHGGDVGTFTGTPWKAGTAETGDAYCILPPARKYPVNSTGILTPEQIEDIKTKTTKTLFSINYNLTFEEAEDQLFREPMMGDIDWDTVTDIQGHLDASYQGDHTSALTIMGRLPNGKLAAIGWTNPGNVKEWLPFILKKLVEYKVKKFHAENNADRGFVMEILRRQPAFMQSHIWPCEYREDTNKTVKIASYALEAWPDTMWDNKCDENYLAQLTTYITDQLPDDCADSYASLVAHGGYSKTKSLDTFFKAWQW